MFCLKYFPYSPCAKEADELKIVYNPADTTLIDFLQYYKDKTIIIDATGKIDKLVAEMFNDLFNKYSNFKLIIDFSEKEALNLIEKYHLPFFFRNYATTIDLFYGYLKYDPTDIYICEELGFFIKRISKIAHDHSVKIRVIPNVCQSSFEETPSMQKFFIRPEDVPYYSAFVDVFELVSDQKRQEVVFNAYKNHKWFGKIKEIIPTFIDDTFDSRFIMSIFPAVRSDCGRRCMYNPGSCNICTRFTEIGKSIQEAGAALL